MFQDAMDLTDTGLFELRRRLEAYAEARLNPSMEASTRMRAYVMNVAHRRAALVAADPGFDAAGATAGALVAERSSAASNGWRRAAAALVAAGLTVAMLAGTAYAAKPGGLLYDTRVWIEMANLPADVVARAEAEISRLDARLAEAQQASTEGDVPGAEAAVAAYSVILAEAAQGSAGDPTASASIEIALTRHVVILTALADSVPAPARAAVQHALLSSTKVLDDLDGAGIPDSRRHAIDADSSRGSRPDGSKPGRPTQAGGTPAGATPEKSPKPDRNAAPNEDAPGQSRPGGANNDGPAAHPTGTPKPDGKPDGPDKKGAT
jgi:hypothetical protein